MTGAILVLSCCKEKYEKARFENWDKSLSKLADHLPIYYLFGQSETPLKIPQHPNVHSIVANCGDHYEDIPLKMYDGYRQLATLDYDYIIKLDENVNITNPERLLQIVEDEIRHHDYLALKGVGFIDQRDESKEGASMNVFYNYSHVNKVHNKQLINVPVILYRVPYAGGSAYVLSKRAYSLLSKNIFLRSLNEDNLVGYELFMNDIQAYSSKCMDEKLICDIDVIDNPYIVDVDFQRQLSSHHIHSFESKLRDVTKQDTCLVRLGGGLGNQLFTIAAGLAYCYKYDMKLELYPMPNSRPYYWDSILSKFKKYVVSSDNHSIPLYEEPAFWYNELPKGIRRLHGYFQSTKYFKSIEGIMKNAITFSDGIEKKLVDKYGPLFTEESVIVHARRGDYERSADIHNPQPDSYYQDALIEIKKRIADPHFILLSDDPSYWSRSSVFKNEKTVAVDESDIDTLFLLTKSKHFIMANSTFSWWGIYLSNAKTVITPKQWFGPRGPQNWQDLYEDGWIKL